MLAVTVALSSMIPPRTNSSALVGSLRHRTLNPLRSRDKTRSDLIEKHFPVGSGHDFRRRPRRPLFRAIPLFSLFAAHSCFHVVCPSIVGPEPDARAAPGYDGAVSVRRRRRSAAPG